MDEFPKLPPAASTIEKGVPLKEFLGKRSIEHLASNLAFAKSDFPLDQFIKDSLKGIKELSLTQRADHIANTMHSHLPMGYSKAIHIILKSLTPPLEKTEDNGIAPMFYMPHCSFIAMYGVDKKYNDGKDPFDVSMKAQYEITQRFTCEFSIRAFLIDDQERTLKVLMKWMNDPKPHIRRLCSEGTRPRLPWASKLQSFIDDPGPVFPILEQLKDDPSLYVRRSVANHVGDIAKDHLDLALDICGKWLKKASPELKWVIRHALRHPSKKGVQEALELRAKAK